MALNRSESLPGTDLSPTNGVEKILETKVIPTPNGIVRYYQVKWSATWETEQNLTKYCSHLIYEFWNCQRQFDFQLQPPTKSDEKINNCMQPADGISTLLNDVSTITTASSQQTSTLSAILSVTERETETLDRNIVKNPRSTYTVGTAVSPAMKDLVPSISRSLNRANILSDNESSPSNTLNLPQPLHLLSAKSTILEDTAQILLNIQPPQPKTTLQVDDSFLQESQDRKITFPMVALASRDAPINFQAASDDSKIRSLENTISSDEQASSESSIKRKRKSTPDVATAEKIEMDAKSRSKNTSVFVPIRSRISDDILTTNKSAKDYSRLTETSSGRVRKRNKVSELFADSGDSDEDGDDEESHRVDDDVVDSGNDSSESDNNNDEYSLETFSDSFCSTGASKRKVRRPRKSATPGNNYNKPLRTWKESKTALKLKSSNEYIETITKHGKETRQPKRKKGESVTCDKCGKEHSKSKCPDCALATCEGCGIKYNNSYYKERCRACTNKCHVCDQSFRKPSDVVKHIEAIHERVKKYTCEVCSKGFAAKQYLKAHMESHKMDANHVCTICSKRYKTGRRLNRHMKTHTGVKPFKCSVCERSFHQKVAMKTHMLTHSEGPKRFQCLLCKKGFNHKVSLKSHMLKHHDKNEQQAAVMIGLWKKYQKDEVSIQSATSHDDMLAKALAAVAMTPLDNQQPFATGNGIGFPFLGFGAI